MGRPAKLLHQILDIIAYREKSDNETLFELYPLVNNTSTQTITKVFKSHLVGLFLELGLLFQYAGTSLRCKNVDHWGKNPFIETLHSNHHKNEDPMG